MAAPRATTATVNWTARLTRFIDTPFRSAPRWRLGYHCDRSVHASIDTLPICPDHRHEVTAASAPSGRLFEGDGAGRAEVRRLAYGGVLARGRIGIEQH